MTYTDAVSEDIAEIKSWIDQDPAHSTFEPEFFAPSEPIDGVKCIKVEDHTGAVFYIRLQNALRVYIQFAPETEVKRSRMASALRRMFLFLGRGAKDTGYHEAVFDSQSPDLIAFFQKFGFTEMQSTYRAKL